MSKLITKKKSLISRIERLRLEYETMKLSANRKDA
jgi:hypothetical protein